MSIFRGSALSSAKMQNYISAAGANEEVITAIYADIYNREYTKLFFARLRFIDSWIYVILITAGIILAKSFYA